MGVFTGEERVGSEALTVIGIIKNFMEIIEEGVGLDKIKENFHARSLVLDTMIDYGMPLISDKSVLISMLK